MQNCNVRPVAIASTSVTIIIGTCSARSGKHWRQFASVPILKFLCTFCLSVECAVTEALDGCQDVIGGFGPAERLGRSISAFDIGGDRALQFGDGSMRTALVLLFGQEREETLDLID